MTTFQSPWLRPWDYAGVTLIGLPAPPPTQSLCAANSAHSRAGEVHPDEWGTGSNNRGVFSGRISLTMPIIGGCSSPRAVADRIGPCNARLAVRDDLVGSMH